MWQINQNDALAGLILLVSALAFLLSWAYQNAKARPAQRESEAALAAEALMHETAERGTRTSLYLGHNLAWPQVDLAGASGLALQNLAARRSIFNDYHAHSSTGDGALALLSRMVTQGYYERAIAPELFRAEDSAWGGSSPMAAVAAFLPEAHSPENGAVMLTGALDPGALFALDLAARAEVPSLSAPSTLSGQTAAFLGSDLLSLGEDAFQTALAEKPAAKAALQAQDILRTLVTVGLLLVAALKLSGVWP